MTTSNLYVCPFVGVKIDISEMDMAMSSFIINAEYEYTFCLKNLDSARESLQWSMDKLQRNVAAAFNGEAYSVNSLGEVQSQGLTVDRYCTELAIRNSNLAIAKKFAMANGATAL